MYPTNRNKLAICLVASIIVILGLLGANGAPSSTVRPSTSGSNKSSPVRVGSLLRGGLLSNLFRRQTSNSNNNKQNNNSNNKENSMVDGDMVPSASDSSASSENEGLTPTEIEAQKFMDSLPGANSQNSGPTTFRERVSESFGLLRDGVSNQFKSLRENWSDTVEDLRETWSGNSQD